MAITATVVAGFLFLTIVIQWLLVAIWCRKSSNSLREPTDRTWQPPATIVLCLRGADPLLPDCLRSLTNQSYADYRLLCVLDSVDDPAAEVTYQVQAGLVGKRSDLVRIIVANPPDGRCSLKNNALMSALKSLDDLTEVIAFADADCVVDENWLADLASPLRDPAIAVSTGNRWYIPPDNRQGSLLRWLWHMAASVQMLVYRIPWGGSMAMTRGFVEQAGLPEIWSTSLFEDTLLYSVSRRQGKRIAVLPHLLVPNQESISTGPALRWIRRQLLNTRLYHPAFKLALLHCMATNCAIVAALGLFSFGMFFGNYAAAGTTAAGLLVYAVFYGFCLRSMSRVGRRIIECRYGKPPESSQNFASVGIAIVVTQVAYALSMLGAILSRKTQWRGVEYLIGGANDIHLVKYRRMQDVVDESPKRNQSIEL